MSQQDVPEWMSLYVYEFFADLNVQAMELDELGAYWRLIGVQWMNGSVPSDLRVLARLLHVRSRKTMERIWKALSPCYVEHPDKPGELIQSRVESERVKALARIKGNSKGGTTSAARRNARKQGDLPVELSPTSELTATQPARERVDIMPLWEEFKGLYPTHRLDEENACRAFISREEEAADIVAGLRAAVVCADWVKDEGRFVPKASNFISAGTYKDHLRTAPAAKKKTVYFDPKSITGGKG
ncbi:MAG: hypothetical protein ABSC23_03920 [Bryobacteraceae bacterium]